MRWDGFPARITALSPYTSRFESYALKGEEGDVIFARYPAGTRITPHSHDTENWGVVTKGEMILFVEGERQVLKPGDWYHVPAEAEHWAECGVDTEQIELWFRQAAA